MATNSCLLLQHLWTMTASVSVGGQCSHFMNFSLKKKKEENLECNSYCISVLTWIGSSETASFNMKVRIRIFQKVLQTGFFNSIREI